MVTLTLRHRRETLSQMIDRLVKHFAAVRRLRGWTSRVDGGCWTMEIKRGARSRRWHVHIHALVSCSVELESWLRAAWHRETKDSHQVKAEFVLDPAKGAAYVAKYITKGWAAEITRCPADLVECLRSLGGRRLLGTFGRNRPARLEDQRPDPARWKPLGRLVKIIELAGTGDLWAVSVLTAITPRRPDAEGPTFHRVPAPDDDPAG